MKKILLPILSALLLTAPAFAQSYTGGTTPETEKKCTALTQKMAQELRLTEFDYIKLKSLNCEFIVKTEAVLASYGNNEGLVREKMQEIELAYEKSIAAFLTPKQMEAYANFRKESSETVFVASTGKK